MGFPIERPRRLRRSAGLRRLVRETTLTRDDLVMPFFVVPGTNVCEPIDSMLGNAHLSVDRLVEACRKVVDAGVGAVLLFGVPENKDALASGSSGASCVVAQAIVALKKALPDLIIITDVCICGYTDHGHCGVVDGTGYVVNDPSLEILTRMAVTHARAGADIVAPSDMMDGRIAALRAGLDEANLTDIAIMSYAVKYASAYYGPFREAADSAPQFGDRRTYQMDAANAREALREVRLDTEEGADMVMVKPALAYMDVIHQVRAASDLPLAAYNVSGEFSMVKAAAANGWIDERAIVMETLTGLKRAGADILITYHALDAAGWL